MADKNVGKPATNVQKQMPTNVTPIKAEKCISEECKRKPDRAGFCEEHYVWFKEGLMTIDGYRAKDFDKKYHDWLRRSKKVA